jgi:enoyl-CoA hydratase/carnithine racemase
MMLTGCRLSAKEALDMRLVNRVVPKGELLPTTDNMARRITSFSPMAIRNAKQAVVKGLDLSLAEGLELEKGLTNSLMQITEVRNRL